MIVSAWHDGGVTYGLRVLRSDVSLWFRPEWEWVTLYLPGEPLPAAVPLSAGFWRHGPQIRSPRIRAFLRDSGLAPWPSGRPPHFELAPLGGGAFRLCRLEPP